MTQPLENYIRTYRRRSGLSQDDIAFLLAVDNGGSISRHECRRRMPELKAALAYAVIFGASLRELFAGEFLRVEDEVKARAEELLLKVKEEISGHGRERRIAFLSALLESHPTLW